MPHRLFRRAFGNLFGKLADFAGHFRHQVFQSAHIAHLLDLQFEIVEVETFAAPQLFCHFGGGLFVYAFLHVLHQRQHVAHAQNARGDAVGVEGFEAVGFFTRAEKLNRLAGDFAHRQGRAAARVAVHFGEDDAGERQGFIERLRGVHRVLAEHGVDDKQGFHRIEGGVQLFDFVHHFLIDGQPAGGIDHQHVVEAAFGLGEGGAGDFDRFLRDVGGEEIGLHLFGEQAQLFDGGGAVHVGGNEQDFFLFVLRFEQAGEFADGGGFARALQTGHQHHGWRGGGKVEATVRAAHQFDEGLVDDGDKCLFRREVFADFAAECLFLHFGDEIAHHGQGDVGFQEGEAHFAQGGFDVVFVERGRTADVFEHGAEAAGKVVEHGIPY